MNKYNNYHKHDDKSNIFTPDVNVQEIDYVNRILELGETNNYFTTNHGFGGDIFESRTVCDDNRLHCKFGMEGYIVPNPLEKDNRNYHIILIPKTNVARKKLNVASSRANTEGYYYKPRLFLEDLLKFDPKELYITTACCFLKDNKVLTNNGYKNIQDIKKGDFVKNINGEFEEVNYPTKIGYVGKGYSIDTNNYIDNIQCTSDHKFLITTLNDIAQNKEPRWVKANELLKYNSSHSKPILLYPLNVEYTNKNVILKSEFENCFKEIKHKWSVKQTLPNKIMITSQFMRMIGLFIGDGHISLKKNPRIGFTINSKEYEYYNSDVFIPIENQLGIKFNRTFRLKTHRVDIVTSSVDMVNLFYYLFENCKAKTKHIPNRLLHITKEFDLELLLGMFLSDGCFRKSSRDGYNSGSCVYCSISKTLITQTQDLCNSLGIKTTYETKQESTDKNNVHHQKSYKITISSKIFYDFNKERHITTEQWVSIINNLYENTNQNPIVIYEDKKYLKVRIKNINEIFIDEDVYCLNNNTHSFVLNGCIVHNCAGLLADDDSINEIFYPLYEHFGKNLMLEVQTHNEDIQKKINTKAIALANELKLPLIGACDSHYIYPEQAKERLELLKGKGINYGSEDNFLLDYPSYDTMCERFKEQGILTPKQITDCMEQTLIFDECENIDIDKTIKMPTIYGDLSEDEKIHLLKDKVSQGFNQMIKEENLNKEQIKLYSKELHKEMRVIEECEEADIPMADYFLLNKEIFDTAINEFGGVLTKSGRGSAGGELINRMLGITQIDRLKINLPIYSERFISTSRVIENRSLADIDINVADQQPFIDAMKKTLGEHQCYPMLAYGTMKESEAFRNVCRSHNLNYDEFNEVGKQIDNYRKDEYWGQYIEEAQKYVGTVISCSVHPCSFILMNEDITEELGIVKIGEFYCAPITSYEADVWKYLKDDILKVVVWEIIAKVFEEIGQPIMTVNELLNKTTDEVWNIIGDGYTATLNQIDGSWATSMVKQYKPRNIEELAMFTGAIRPNFASFRDNFINRIPQSTGAKELDEVLSQTGGQIIMQECLMKYFEWLDISPAESIGLIKKISKKKIKESDFKKLETTLRKTWIEKVGNDDNFDYTWNALQDQMSYGYCSAHATAVALDCLYCAYLKANYPLEYYTVVLNIYQDDLEKTNRLVEEMKHFGITLGNITFRHSFDKYGYDKETKIIYKSILSIKNIGKACCENFYTLKDKKYNNFLSLLYDIKTKSVCNSAELDILIKLDYFSDFGDINYLLNVVKYYNKYIDNGNFGKTKRKQFRIADLDDVKKYYPFEKETILKFKTEESKNGNTIYVSEENMYKLIVYLCSKLKKNTTTLYDRITYEATLLGYVSITSSDSPYWAVTNVDVNQYGTPFASLYRVSDGLTEVYKVNRQYYKEYGLNTGDIIYPLFNTKNKSIKKDNKWVQTDETYEELSAWKWSD